MIRGESRNKNEKPLTITDIAKRAGVSISTVSRVINNSNLVSKKTKRKVMRIIEETNFIPNEMARGLLKKTSKTVAVIIPNISNPFFIELVHGIEDTVNKYGYSMFLCNSNLNREKEKEFIKQMAERRTDGIIITSTFLHDKEMIYRLHKRLRIVTVQTEIEGIDCVNTTDRKGTREAIEHLISLGHTKIAMIGYGLDVKASGNRRQEYIETLKRHNIPLRDKYIINEGMKGNMGYFMANRLLDLPEPPTAIFALNDYLALGAYLAVMEKGLKIPDDISIVGFDNIMVAKLCNPPLTTVAQPVYSMGETAGKLLIENIEDGPKAVRKEVLLPTRLIIRGSTAPPRSI